MLTILPIPDSLVEKHNFALVCVLCQSVDGLFSLGADFSSLATGFLSQGNVDARHTYKRQTAVFSFILVS